MSQSVNHGEKSVSSTGDTVEPVEDIGPSQPTSAEPAEERTEQQTGAAASPAEAGNPDETPTVDLNDGSDDEEGTAQEPDDEAPRDPPGGAGPARRWWRAVRWRAALPGWYDATT